MAGCDPQGIFAASDEPESARLFYGVGGWARVDFRMLQDRALRLSGATVAAVWAILRAKEAGRGVFPSPMPGDVARALSLGALLRRCQDAAHGDGSHAAALAPLRDLSPGQVEALAAAIGDVAVAAAVDCGAIIRATAADLDRANVREGGTHWTVPGWTEAQRDPLDKRPHSSERAPKDAPADDPARIKASVAAARRAFVVELQRWTEATPHRIRAIVGEFKPLDLTPEDWDKASARLSPVVSRWEQCDGEAARRLSDGETRGIRLAVEHALGHRSPANKPKRINPPQPTNVTPIRAAVGYDDDGDPRSGLDGGWH